MARRGCSGTWGIENMVTRSTGESTCAYANRCVALVVLNANNGNLASSFPSRIIVRMKKFTTNGVKPTALACVLAFALAASAQSPAARTIVLPSPQLVHCRSSECSRLWQQGAARNAEVYPSQVLTDLVNGEVVGLTAVYDKSVSADELRAAIDRIYGKRASLSYQGDQMSTWRIESEQIAISILDGDRGTKEVTYLKFGPRASLVPSAHIDYKK